MKIDKRLIFAILGVVIIVLGGAFVLWLRTPKGYSGKMESIAIGIPSSFFAYTHTCIAEDQRFFARNGIIVTIRDYDQGLDAIDSMLNGGVDIAAPSEFPIVEKALKKERVRIIASTIRGETFYLIGRKDRGIKNTLDLKGKRVGLRRGSIAEFYFGRFLNLHGMNMKDVTLVEVKSEKLADAISEGKVDAVITHQPFVYDIEERLGAHGKVWPAQSGQPMYGIMVSRDDWITRHPELVNRFVNSLVQAEEYIINHPDGAKAIIQKRFKFDRASIERMWQVHQFSLSLDQSLITAMEDEARWMIKNKLTSEKHVPDFVNYIYIDGLKAVKPEAVNIIH
jgi:NitT/TauT family transport system substrate-binding protein